MYLTVRRGSKNDRDISEGPSGHLKQTPSICTEDRFSIKINNDSNEV